MTPSSRFLRALLLGSLLCALPARAGDASFNRVVKRLAATYHAKPLSAVGWATFFMRPFTPSGVHGLSVEVFEEVPTAVSGIGGEAFEQGLREAMDPGYELFVRVRSASSQEATLIYLREAGRNCDLLLVSAERREAVVVGMRLDPEALQKWLADPGGMGRSWAKGHPSPDQNRP